jgi:hypothetical protein
MRPVVATEKIGPYLYFLYEDGIYRGHWASTPWGARWLAWRLSRRQS